MYCETIIAVNIYPSIPKATSTEYIALAFFNNFFVTGLLIIIIFISFLIHSY